MFSPRLRSESLTRSTYVRLSSLSRKPRSPVRNHSRMRIDLQPRPAGRRRHIPLAHRMWRPRPAGDLPDHTPAGTGCPCRSTIRTSNAGIDPSRRPGYAFIGHGLVGNRKRFGHAVHRHDAAAVALLDVAVHVGRDGCRRDEAQADLARRADPAAGSTASTPSRPHRRNPRHRRTVSRPTPRSGGRPPASTLVPPTSIGASTVGAALRWNSGMAVHSTSPDPSSHDAATVAAAVNR